MHAYIYVQINESRLSRGLESSPRILHKRRFIQRTAASTSPPTSSAATSSSTPTAASIIVLKASPPAGPSTGAGATTTCKYMNVRYCERTG